MNRLLPICFFLTFLAFTLLCEENSSPYEDDISRLELLGFNYFSTPLPMSEGRLIDPEGRPVLVNGSTEQVLLIVFTSGEDPFASDLRKELSLLSDEYRGRPFKILTVSLAEEDFKDRGGRTGDKWGVLRYPTILLVDHNFNLRGSSEGIYPEMDSEGFRKVIDELILDIKSPGIINTLQ